MTRRLTPFVLGAALLTWAGTGFPAATGDKHAASSGTKQTARGAHDKAMDRMMAGMSAAEKQYMRGHMTQMSADHRKMMMDHMTQMSPDQRRRMVQQLMKGAGTVSMMHGHGGMGGHGASGKSHGGTDHSKPPSGKAKSDKTQEPVPLAVGEQVPDLVVRDLEGKALRLSDLRRQTKSGVVSLTFWCSFCHSCRPVETRLDRFAREHKDQAVVAAIDASAGETAAGVAAFARQRGISLPILMDAPGKAADLFGVQKTTTTVVIDGQGVLRYRGQFVEGDQMPAADALKAVLAGEPVTWKETPQRG
jgi:thiol-disulfide isomerase/thioredoxin